MNIHPFYLYRRPNREEISILHEKYQPMLSFQNKNYYAIANFTKIYKNDNFKSYDLFQKTKVFIIIP
jgi:hypothetical protein